MDQSTYKPHGLDGLDLPEGGDQRAAAKASLPRRHSFKFTLREEVCLCAAHQVFAANMPIDASLLESNNQIRDKLQCALR